MPKHSAFRELIEVEEPSARRPTLKVVVPERVLFSMLALRWHCGTRLDLAEETDADLSILAPNWVEMLPCFRPRGHLRPRHVSAPFEAAPQVAR